MSDAEGLTEIQARALLKLPPHATHRGFWEATRLRGGWQFSFQPPDGEVLVGGRPMVVTDSGLKGVCGLAETGQDAIDRLLTPPSWWSKATSRFKKRRHLSLDDPPERKPLTPLTFTEGITVQRRSSPPTPSNLPYRINSMECARATEYAWRRGQLNEAAGRAPVQQPNGLTVVTGEPAWHHEEWTGIQLSPATGEEILATLRDAGHGSSGVIITEWFTSSPEHPERRAAHAYNLQNFEGDVLCVDGQIGETGPPHPTALHPLLAGKPVARHLWIGWGPNSEIISANTAPAKSRFPR